MFSSWFDSRAARSSAKERFFRPRLECLEGRLAPSSLMGADMGHGHGHGNGNGNGNGGDDNGGGDDRGGDEPPGQMRENDDNEQGGTFINSFDNFNTTINNSFNIVFNNLAANQFLFVAGLPQTQLQQLFGFSFGLAMQTNPQAALSLATDEVHLATDTSMVLSSALLGAAPNPNLLQDIHNIQTSIQHNPLESTFVGQVAGALAFDLALRASLPSQLSGQAHG